MNRLLSTSSLVATTVVAALSIVGTASAQVTQMDIDLNNFRVTGDVVSNTEYTLSMIDDHDTIIESIRIDGDDAAGFYDPFAGNTTADYSAIVNLTGSKSSGTVTSGIFQLTDDVGNVFSFDEVSGSYFDTGTGIELVLIMASDDGEFNSNTFSGVDVTTFNTAQSLDVSIVTFLLDRKVLVLDNFTDNAADADIAIVAVVPSPERDGRAWPVRSAWPDASSPRLSKRLIQNPK